MFHSRDRRTNVNVAGIRFRIVRLEQLRPLTFCRVIRITNDTNTLRYADTVNYSFCTCTCTSVTSVAQKWNITHLDSLAWVFRFLFVDVKWTVIHHRKSAVARAMICMCFYVYMKNVWRYLYIHTDCYVTRIAPGLESTLVLYWWTANIT